MVFIVRPATVVLDRLASSSHIHEIVNNGRDMISPRISHDRPAGELVAVKLETHRKIRLVFVFGWNPRVNVFVARHVEITPHTTVCISGSGDGAPERHYAHAQLNSVVEDVWGSLIS